MSNYNNDILLEQLPETYYDVEIFEHGVDEPIDGWFFYGTPEDVVFMMDCCLHDYDDWDTLSACISLEGVDLIYMPDLSGPDYEFINDEAVRELAA